MGTSSTLASERTEVEFPSKGTSSALVGTSSTVARNGWSIMPRVTAVRSLAAMGCRSGAAGRCMHFESSEPQGC